MDIQVLLTQMCVIFILIIIGYIITKRGAITVDSAKTLSFIVVNISNPCLLLNSAITYEGRLSLTIFLEGLGFSILCYAILIGASYLLPLLLRIERKDWFSFQMMCVYGNVGFIGIPICNAVLGPESIVYVSINCLVFNLLIYTYGEAVLHHAKELNSTTSDHSPFKLDAKRLINVGTISAVLTVFIYFLDPKLPVIVTDTIAFAGNSTTFLSMLVLGSSIAAIPFAKLFDGKRVILFVLLRGLCLPLLMLLVLGQIIKTPLLLGTTAMMLSLPGANMPLMMCKNLDLKEDELSRGIILSTIFSIGTIPLVIFLAGI